MTHSVTLVNTAADTWQTVIDRVNTLANLASNAMVTVNQTNSGSSTTGNAVVNGVFQANVFAVETGLRGGTVNAAAALVITTNTEMQGTATVNGAVNATAVNIGANVQVTAGGASVGNSTANVQVNSTAVVIGGSNAAVEATKAAATANNGSTIARGRLNFVEGSGVTITVTDDSGGSQVNVTISSTGGGSTTPGGSNTQIQFNDSGAMAGAAGLSWDKTSNNFTVANTIHAPVLSANSGAVRMTHVASNTSGTTAQLIDSWSGSTFRTAFYQVSIKNNSANGYAATQLTLIFKGSDVDLLEYGMMATNTSLGTWSSNVSGSTVRLYFTPTPANTAVNAARTLIVV